MHTLGWIKIGGYRPFRELDIHTKSLEVLVGANGSGKSSFFEFLRFLRDGMEGEIPPTIVPGNGGKRVFHERAPSEAFRWTVTTGIQEDEYIEYGAEVVGPIGTIRIGHEIIMYSLERHGPAPAPILDLKGGEGTIRDLSPFLDEAPQQEHPQAFEQLNRRLASLFKSFERIRVKAQGAPGEVLAFVKEQGLKEELSLADMSDGILRLMCWSVLCTHPSPPPLVCVDEPVQGVHPRAVGLLAGMFEKLASKTQVFVATHSSYFLSHFDTRNILVFIRQHGESVARRAADSAALQANLRDFGADELQWMHRSDELKLLSEMGESSEEDTDEDEEGA